MALSPPSGGTTTGEFGAYLTVLRKRFARAYLPLCSLGIGSVFAQNTPPQANRGTIEFRSHISSLNNVEFLIRGFFT